MIEFKEFNPLFEWRILERRTKTVKINDLIFAVWVVALLARGGRVDRCGEAVGDFFIEGRVLLDIDNK